MLRGSERQARSRPTKSEPCALVTHDMYRHELAHYKCVTDGVVGGEKS